jgi:hypothetical protein
MDNCEEDTPMTVFEEVAIGFRCWWDIDEDIDLMTEAEVCILVFLNIFFL